MVSVPLQFPGFKVRPLPLRLYAPTTPLPFSSASIRTHLFTAYNPSSEITLKVIDELLASTISICNDLKPMIELESKSY
jgi:hypothetical protein